MLDVHGDVPGAPLPRRGESPGAGEGAGATASKISVHATDALSSLPSLPTRPAAAPACGRRAEAIRAAGGTARGEEAAAEARRRPQIGRAHV